MTTLNEYTRCLDCRTLLRLPEHCVICEMVRVMRKGQPITAESITASAAFVLPDRQAVWLTASAPEILRPPSRDEREFIVPEGENLYWVGRVTYRPQNE